MDFDESLFQLFLEEEEEDNILRNDIYLYQNLENESFGNDDFEIDHIEYFDNLPERYLDESFLYDDINYFRDAIFLNENFDNLYGGNSLYEVVSITVNKCQKFNCNQKIIKLNIFQLDNNNFIDAMDNIRKIFEKIYNEYIIPINENNMVRLVFKHRLFNNPISIPFMNKEDISVNLMLSAFERVVQSYKKLPENELTSTDEFVIDIVEAQLPRGAGRPRKGNTKPGYQKVVEKKKTRICKPKQAITDLNSFLASKRSVIRVFNTDNYCLLRAILIGKAFVDMNPLKKEYAK